MHALRVGVIALAPVLLFAAKDKDDSMKRITEAGNVFSEIMNAGDKAIPEEILNHAQCIGIVPALKRAGFIVGAKYGKGVLVCRTENGRWSGPATIRIEGGSFGFQIGAGETDLVFVVRNKSGEDKLLKDKFTFGGDASAMAGPVGRSAEAQTDAMMHAEILSWSRARGVFAGVALDGSTMRPDNEDNREVYGHDVTEREILSGSVSRPTGAGNLYSIIDRYTPARSATRH